MLLRENDIQILFNRIMQFLQYILYIYILKNPAHTKRTKDPFPGNGYQFDFLKNWNTKNRLKKVISGILGKPP